MIEASGVTVARHVVECEKRVNVSSAVTQTAARIATATIMRPPRGCVAALGVALHRGPRGGIGRARR